jgi:hypothetical protein
MKKSFTLLLLFLLLGTIPLGVYLVKRQQELRIKAGPSAGVKSKIGIQTQFLEPGVMEFIETAKPVVVKLLNPALDRAAEIKQKSPSTFIVGRIYEPSQPMDNNPQTRAQEWFDRNRSTIQANPEIDCWEGYNEPGCENGSSMQWIASFEKRRVELLASIGVKACIGSFSVGRPSLELWPNFYSALQTAKNNGGYLSLHEYSAPNMKCLFDAGAEEGWLTGRYRKVYRHYLIPNNLVIPLIITETGIDGGVCSTPECNCSISGGWRDYTNTGAYLNELRWYDSVLNGDNYVIGATIFQYGLYGWDSFEIWPELTGSDGTSGPLTGYIRGAGSTPTPTPTPIPFECHPDDQMIFMSQPSINQPLTIKVTSPEPYPWVVITVNGENQAGPDDMGGSYWWEWDYTPTASGQYTVRFYVNAEDDDPSQGDQCLERSFTITTPTPTPTPIPEDLNQDGVVNSQDINILLQNWGDSSSVSEADFNSDGVVNGMDFGMMLKLIL